MKKITTAVIVWALLTGVVACEGFRDLTPENVTVRMTGADGTQVRAIYSKNFRTGVDELDVTLINVFSADTVFSTLPLDTVINIAIERQFLVQIETLANDSIEVGVLIKVDDRDVVRKFGAIFPDVPFSYVFQFNFFVTPTIEIVF